MKYYFLILFFLIVLFSAPIFAQEGVVKIQKSDNIERLLSLKKEINKSKKLIKIQIYNGSRAGAESTLSSFRSNFSDYASDIKYETPNYKIWVGNFKTKMEADRALKHIKKDYPNAFPFSPKQD